MAGEEEPENPFRSWLSVQRELQIEGYGRDPIRLGLYDKIDFLIWNMWACEDELHEAMREVGWKPWATSRHFNREAFVEEIVDVLHFVGNMLLTAGVLGVEDLAIEVWDKYQKKAAINLERQRVGYDGVSDKCPQCGRNLVEFEMFDDDEVTVIKRCPQHGEVTQ
jgi:dUTPase